MAIGPWACVSSVFKVTVTVWTVNGTRLKTRVIHVTGLFNRGTKLNVCIVFTEKKQIHSVKKRLLRGLMNDILTETMSMCTRDNTSRVFKYSVEIKYNHFIYIPSLFSVSFCIAYIWYWSNPKVIESNQMISLKYCNTWIILQTAFFPGHLYLNTFFAPDLLISNDNNNNNNNNNNKCHYYHTVVLII